MIIDFLPLGTLWAAFHQSEWFGKMIIAILLLGSIATWCVMLSKRIDLKNMQMQGQLFLNAFRDSRGGPLALCRKPARFEPTPLEVIYRAAVGAWCPEDAVSGQAPFDHADREAVRSMADRVLAEQLLRIERGMSTLATATTAAPFLGLLGTVWGVMSAFQGMMGQGVVLLGNVAPGISGALATTVVGLMVALPSAIGYNYLSDRVRALQVDMENFVEELMVALARESRHDAGAAER